MRFTEPPLPLLPQRFKAELRVWRAPEPEDHGNPRIVVHQSQYDELLAGGVPADSMILSQRLSIK